MCGSVAVEEDQVAERGPFLCIKGVFHLEGSHGGIQSHESSSCHREAMQMIVELPQNCPDVGEMLSREHATEKEQNRECLLKIISSLRVLARQGLPVGGEGMRLTLTLFSY